MERTRRRTLAGPLDRNRIFSDLDVVISHHTHTGLKRMQIYLYLLFDDPLHSALARGVQFVVNALILATAATEVIRSYSACHYVDWRSATIDLDGAAYSLAELPQNWPHVYRVCNERPALRDEPLAYFIVETISVSVFTIEYLLRLFAAPAVVGLRHFLVSPMNVIDLLAIVPYYIELPTRIELLGCSNHDCNVEQIDISFLLVMRLMRILRIFKAVRTVRSFHVLTRTLRESAPVLLVLALVLVLFCTLFAAVITPLEEGVYVTSYEHRASDRRGAMLALDGRVSTYNSMLSTAYWVMQTFAAIGFGDMVPRTDAGMFFSSIVIVFGLVSLALPITLISVNFDSVHQEHKRMERLTRESRTIQHHLQTRAYTRPLPPPPASGSILAWVESKRRSILREKELLSDPSFADSAMNVKADLASLVHENSVQLHAGIDRLVFRSSHAMLSNVQQDLSTAYKKLLSQTVRDAEDKASVSSISRLAATIRASVARRASLDPANYSGRRSSATPPTLRQAPQTA